MGEGQVDKKVVDTQEADTKAFLQGQTGDPYARQKLDLARRDARNGTAPDRSALGILTSAMGRIVARDQELSKRLHGLGVPGEDEDEVLIAVANRLEELRHFYRFMGIVPDFGSPGALRAHLDALTTRLRYGEALVRAVQSVTAQPLPSDSQQLEPFFRGRFFVTMPAEKPADVTPSDVHQRVPLPNYANGYSLEGIEARLRKLDNELTAKPKRARKPAKKGARQ